MINDSSLKPGPPGQIKIEQALRELLEEKDFTSITTAEIARTSGVNEALIYRYFKDKRGLLHHVLTRDLEAFVLQIQSAVEGIQGSLEKLRRLIRGHIQYYHNNRIFAKILLLEVRNNPGYFESEVYRIVMDYSQLILDILNNGIAAGEIRNDIAPQQIRQAILGGIEHLCLHAVVFGRPIPADEYGDNLCKTIFDGISTK